MYKNSKIREVIKRDKKEKKRLYVKMCIELVVIIIIVIFAIMKQN